MKTFETPNVEVINFTVEDIITTSSGEDWEYSGYIGDNCIS